MSKVKQSSSSSQFNIDTTSSSTTTSSTPDIDPSYFYTDLHDVPNPPWEELKQHLIIGKNSLGPAYGSTIRIYPSAINDGDNSNSNNSPYTHRPIMASVKLHVPIHSCIGRRDFSKITRWYQEDDHKKTQIFRMFPGDDNVRNARALAPRSEAFCSTVQWKRGDGWYEFSARYTFVQVRGGAVFQLKHNDQYWSIQLNLERNRTTDNYDLVYNKLHAPQSKFRLEQNVVFKSYDVRILDNGTAHQVYINGKLRVESTFTDRKDTEYNHARWGLYSPNMPWIVIS